MKEKFERVVNFFKMLHFISKVTGAVCTSFVEVYGSNTKEQKDETKQEKE